MSRVDCHFSICSIICGAARWAWINQQQIENKRGEQRAERAEREREQRERERAAAAAGERKQREKASRWNTEEQRKKKIR